MTDIEAMKREHGIWYIKSQGTWKERHTENVLGQLIAGLESSGISQEFINAMKGAGNAKDHQRHQTRY